MDNYQDLIKQREIKLVELASLEQKINQARLAELQTVFAELRDLITAYTSHTISSFLRRSRRESVAVQVS